MYNDLLNLVHAGSSWCPHLTWIDAVEVKTDDTIFLVKIEVKRLRFKKKLKRYTQTKKTKSYLATYQILFNRNSLNTKHITS